MQHKKFWKTITIISLLGESLLLSACGDQVAAILEGKEARAERYHEEGKAVGNACRHAGRAIEDCYTIYNWLPRSGIFEGWREMDKYMRKYSLETVKPILPPPENPNAPKKEEPKKKKKKAKTDENATIEPLPLTTSTDDNANKNVPSESEKDKEKENISETATNSDNKIEVDTNANGDLIIK